MSRQIDHLPQMENALNTQLDAARSVLVIHTAVCYDPSQGLGIGLVQRVACAKTGRTKSDVLDTKTRLESRS